VELLFSSTGRIGRSLFLATVAFLLLLTVAYQMLGDAPGFAFGWTRWIVYPPLLFMTACVLCKRLHDRGRRGWWAGLVLLAVWQAWPDPHDWRQILWFAILLLALVDLGLLPGQTHANRFGPDLVKAR
jgi:uncharacterized membrane protein YhaH (DUF805 family)